MGLLVACTDEEEENGTTDNGSISENESVVKMTVDVRGNDKILKIELDGDRFNERWGEDFKGDHIETYESIPFPKDLTVNWGDGTETNSNTHQYAVEGKYQITLKCQELRSLYINNRVKDIALSQAKDLEYLNIDNYKDIELKSLDISANKKLKFLSIYGAPLIDISVHSDLIYLLCNSIQGELGKLDFSKNTKLQYLYLSCENEITSLNIKDCKELVYLRMAYADISDETANKIYNDLPKGKTWTYDEREYSSYIFLGYKKENNGNTPVGDISIAKQKGWTDSRY